jgi:hypothetical protein
MMIESETVPKGLTISWSFSRVQECGMSGEQKGDQEGKKTEGDKTEKLTGKVEVGGLCLLYRQEKGRNERSISKPTR